MWGLGSGQDTHRRSVSVSVDLDDEEGRKEAAKVGLSLPVRWRDAAGRLGRRSVKATSISI